MDEQVVYLKINPDTFRLTPKQFFQIDTCQFCGSDHLYHRKIFTNNSYYRDISWVVRCFDCNKTVATISKTPQNS